MPIKDERWSYQHFDDGAVLGQVRFLDPEKLLQLALCHVLLPCFFCAEFCLRRFYDITSCKRSSLFYFRLLVQKYFFNSFTVFRYF